MLGRKTYTQDELHQAETAMTEQLAAYKKLVKAVGGATSDPKVDAAFEAFERHFCNNLTLALDRYFVHRLRMVAGKDGNPLNEVELLVESLMNNAGVLRGNNVIKLIPEQSVLGHGPGDQISLDAERFERLSKAFLEEIDAKFVD